MFQRGDMIVYGNTGVCRVEEVGRLKAVRGTDKEKLYYTLTPLYQSGVIYVPVDTTVFMRPVLTHHAADELIQKIPCIREEPLQARDQKALTSHYQALFATHKCEDLLQLIKTLYGKGHSGQIDQRYMKRAEELLYGELAVSLGISCGDVVQYISDRVSAGEA